MNEIDENKNYDMNDDEKEYLYVETNYKNSDHSDKLNTIFNTTDIAQTKDSGIYTNNPKKIDQQFKENPPTYSGSGSSDDNDRGHRKDDEANFVIIKVKNKIKEIKRFWCKPVEDR